MPDAADALRSWAIAGPAIVAVAAATSAGLIVALRPLLQRYAVAHPNARSSHHTPTPQGGGIAVIAATVAVTAAAVFALGPVATLPALHLPVVLAATVCIAVIGAVDDVRGLPVAPRLLLQAVAAGAVIATLPAEWRIAGFLPWWLDRALLLVGALWFINLVNFMDGIDWMTVAEAAPVTLGVVLVAFVGALPAAGTVVALALAGAILGFAPFNRPVAKLFLGDVGSLPIGLLLGWLLLMLAMSGYAVAALLLPLYYLADTTITLMRRLTNGETVWQAHRTHFYQRATDRGFTVTEVVARVFAVNLVLAALALASAIARHAAVDVAALAAGFALVAWLLAQFTRGKR